MWPFTRSRRLLAKLVAISAVLGGAAAAGAATTGVLSGGSSSAQPASFAVLSERPTPLPGVTPMLRQFGVNPQTDARLAFSSGSLRYFVVTPGNSGLLCLTVFNADAMVNSCHTRSALTSQSVIWIGHPKPGGVFDVYGLAPDGAETARVGQVAAAIRNNAFLIHDAPSSAHDLVVSGPNIQADLDMGEQVPPGVTVAPDPQP